MWFEELRHRARYYCACSSSWSNYAADSWIAKHSQIPFMFWLNCNSEEFRTPSTRLRASELRSERAAMSLLCRLEIESVKLLQMDPWEFAAFFDRQKDQWCILSTVGLRTQRLHPEDETVSSHDHARSTCFDLLIETKVPPYTCHLLSVAAHYCVVGFTVRDSGKKCKNKKTWDIETKHGSIVQCLICVVFSSQVLALRKRWLGLPRRAW